MLVKRNTVLFASDDTPPSITDAKTYIKRFALTSDMVKLVKIENQVRVVVIKDFKFESVIDG